MENKKNTKYLLRCIYIHNKQDADALTYFCFITFLLHSRPTHLVSCF